MAIVEDQIINCIFIVGELSILFKPKSGIIMCGSYYKEE